MQLQLVGVSDLLAKEIADPDTMITKFICYERGHVLNARAPSLARILKHDPVDEAQLHARGNACLGCGTLFGDRPFFDSTHLFFVAQLFCLPPPMTLFVRSIIHTGSVLCLP